MTVRVDHGHDARFMLMIVTVDTGRSLSVPMCMIVPGLCDVVSLCTPNPGEAEDGAVDGGPLDALEGAVGGRGTPVDACGDCEA